VKIKATARQIRALLELAALDRGLDGPGSAGPRHDRETAAARVPRRLLDRYLLLLEVGRTPVVVAIERGACSGCHVRLPIMVDQAARRTPAVHTCPHCRRMLFAPELLAGVSHAEPGDSRGAGPAAAGRRS
jgi:predicted  nucleic acid-binding Zn-ribbon protein